MRAIKWCALVVCALHVVLLGVSCGHETGYASDGGMEMRIIVGHIVVLTESERNPGYYRQVHWSSGLPIFLIGAPPLHGRVIIYPVWIGAILSGLASIVLVWWCAARKRRRAKESGATMRASA
jgi:hypothetical protein